MSEPQDPQVKKVDATAVPPSAPPVPARTAALLDSEEVKTEDPVTDKAIDDITAQESDEVLAAEDAALAQAFDPAADKPSFKARAKAFLKSWWDNPKARYGTIAGLVTALVLLFALPPSRYFVLNTVGVRASARVTVLDQSTQQPLKNVDVTVATKTVKTNGDGVAVVSRIKLGGTTLSIHRRAFATVNKKIVVGWGSNPQGSVNLKPTGSQYDFSVSDFMSGKGIAKAEAVASDTDAVADDKGNLVLTVDPSQTSPLQVVIKAAGYRDETVSLNLDEKAVTAVKMVPAAKHVFVSRRAGKYDLYAIDVDGKNEKLLLAGTGTERDDITILSQPSKNLVAIASSRDTVRNQDGYLLTTLNVIDAVSGEKSTVTQAEDVRIIDWYGSRLVYVQTVAGASAANPKRQRLVSYDAETNSQKELASSNYFNDIASAGGNVYYAPSDYNTTASPGVFKSNPDGTSRITILNKTVWNITRTQHDHLALLANQDWFDYKLGDVSTTKLSGGPSSQVNRIYADNSDHKQSLWVENRDGKGVLLQNDVATGKDSVLRTQSGLQRPVYWLNDNYAVYRIHTDQENADYVLNVTGGQPRKISNVTTTRDVGSWYGN